MGKLVVLGAMALATIGATAGAAGAQQGPGAGYPPPGPMGAGPMGHGPMGPGPMVHGPMGPGPMGPMGPGRPAPHAPQQWGSSVGGHWWGGVNAPGGWAGYRQPQRGYRVPGYWVSPRFQVTDWNYYGLPQPIGGYSWVRYYDDAVMIDRGGQVYDYRSGIDWDGRYDDGGYARGGSNGVGGAVAGAVVGGVAGNVIAGRGNRLGGTLIGAGVGAAAGYAIDRSHDRRGPPPGYYDGPRPGGPVGPPPPPRDDDGYRGAPGSSWVSADGRTTVTTVGGGAGYPVVSAPYGYMSGGTVTTVTIQSAPVVTTTTTEVIEDRVTYTRPVARKVYRKRVYHVRLRARCGCGS